MEIEEAIERARGKDIDWYEVKDLFDSLVESLMTTERALCESGWHEGVSMLDTEIGIYLRGMRDVIITKIAIEEGAEELPWDAEERIEERRRKTLHEEYMREREQLPPRGTGLEIGTAGERRAGVPRTEEERIARHREVFGEELEEETGEEW